ncbi:MAG: MFS transporter, partial [Staphylococcus epidermidis]|nr:MFS transporter [Staphylococcus epidermidis]
VNTFVLFLGTAIAPILMLFVGELSNFFLQFLMIAIVGLIALVVSIFMPGDQRS